MTNPSILVIDDSRSVRKSLERKLGELGASVFTAGDGEEGFERAVSTPLDLVISDVEMPGMDGFTLCGRLKKHPATRSVPVIILSTCDSDADINRGFSVGAAAYVLKQRANHDLIPRVKEVLSRTSLLRDRLLLLVDDSRAIRETLGESLQQAGFMVITAEDGQAALDILAEHTPDIILSDINMPRLDGAGLCEAVRRLDRLSGVPFVAMSTESDRRVMREMVQRGASAYLIKPFNPEQLVILAERLLSDHVRIILKEKKLLVAERDSLLSSISSLIQALEARDNYTRGHSDAVAGISARVGERMGLGPLDIEKLELAGRLHDIGKIGIRDDILLKPGRLTPEEYEMIKRHPTIGAEILGPIASMERLIPGILHHHEKFDGTGYPGGLKGLAIPLFARIIAVGDVFHSLTSQRPYRDPITARAAIGIIRNETGTHLCPECVNAFLAEMDN
ncbi:MAG: response regulator [Thermodesulfobacteriota bacterium]